MRLQLMFVFFIGLIIFNFVAFSQVTEFPYSENFDGVTAPILPSDWSGVGFATYASSPRSNPNCVSATGNRSIKTLISPVFNFTSRLPDKLIFWERRTSTAVAYRLEVRASVDGVNFGILLARFDSITMTTSYVERTIDLSNSELKFQSNVQFEWIVLADSTNNTGVLRIDDVLLSVIIGYDVGLTNMISSPNNPTRKDSITLSAVVKNDGSLISSNFSIRFFCDDNINGLNEPSEQFSILNGISLNPGDSLTCIVTHAPMKAGEHRFITTIDFSSDENHINDTARAIVTVGNIKGDILVNEIMYAPVGDEPEWVEFINTSPDTINLKKWRISDSNVSTKSLLTSSDVFISPNAFLIIAKDTVFNTLHPGVSFLVSSFAALNNTTPDAVVIYDPSLHSIDSVAYQPSWGGQNGKSLERIDVQASSTAPSNWATSQDTLGSTPGRTNSIARLDYDLCIKSLRQTQTIVNGEAISGIDVVVGNAGKKQVDSVIIHFYNDDNRNSNPEAFELIQTLFSPTSIAAGDSLVLHESMPQLSPGETDMIVKVDYWRDERIQNNQAAIQVRTSFMASSIVINEIMVAPSTGECEWLELYNRGSIPIDIAHWIFHDLPTASGSVNQFLIATQPTTINSHDFVVIAADSSIIHLLPSYARSDSSIHVIIMNRSGGLGFNNDADVVILQDLTGNTIDSLDYYLTGSEQNGKSLERIDTEMPSALKTNWGMSQDSLGSTPGRINSIARLEYDAAIGTVKQSFKTVNGKIRPIVEEWIINNGRQTADSMSVQLFSDKNRNTIPDSCELIQTIFLLQALAAGDSVFAASSPLMLPSGETQIIVVVQFRRDERLRNNHASLTVQTGSDERSAVINEIMFEPLDGQNEWFEVYNRSQDSIDLQGWSFNDKETASGVNSFFITHQSRILVPSGFIVVAADSSFFQMYPELYRVDSLCAVFVLSHSSGFSFNNDADAIVLKDITGKTIDSVAYSAHWHSPNIVDIRGRSLERINPNVDSNDPRNWNTCTDVTGGTPAKLNSIFAASTSNSARLSFSPNPFSPDGDGFEDFCVVHYNLPLSSSTINVRIYDIKGRLIRRLVNGEPAGFQGDIIWDGLDDNKQRARIGVYVVFLEATDRSNGKVVTAKAVVVVATKL